MDSVYSNCKVVLKVLKFVFKPQCAGRNYLPKVIASLEEDEWFTDQVHETHYWLSRVRLFATPWTVARQAPPSMEFSRQKYWSGLPSGVTGKCGLGVQNEAGQRLTEFCQENALVIANTLFKQHKRRLYTWTSPDGQYQNQIDYILFSQRWRSSIQSTKTRPGADCGSDHELLTPNSDLNWRK